MKYIFPCFLQGQQDKTREKFWKREGWSWYESRTEKGKRQLRKQKRKTRSSENRKILRSVCCGIKGKDFTLNKVLTPKRLLWNFRLNWRYRQPCSNWNSISRFKNEDLSSLESQVVVLTIIDVRLNWKKNPVSRAIRHLTDLHWSFHLEMVVFDWIHLHRPLSRRRFSIFHVLLLLFRGLAAGDKPQY